jgi:transposase
MEKIEESTGIDVSKDTIDAHIHFKNQHKVFPNNNKGFKELIEWMKKITDLELKQIIICFEHTGLYSLPLATFLSQQTIDFCMVPGLEIKKSMGVTRGKNDKVDALRIAEYAYLRREKLELYTLPSENLMNLQNLLVLRERMVSQRSGYQANLMESKKMLLKRGNELHFKTQEQMIEQLSKHIEKLEIAIKDIIKNDEQLNKHFALITSIKGIGLILAVNLLLTTNCFSKFDDARQYACYAGIAPFGYQSGTSIHSKSKVSHFANKRMKSLLFLSALSAITCDSELKQYYQKRVGEGKSKMSTINIVRNKIIYRVFAVVKRGTPYVPLYKHAA